MIDRLLKLKYIIIFLIIAQLIISGVAMYNESHDKNLFLENKTELVKIEYDTIYQKIKEQSTMIFQEQINTKEIVDIFKDAYSSSEEERIKIRNNLYNKLLPSYNRLHKLIKLRQLHFHLPNNHSFLRMHRPDSFGDDLSDVRDTVAYVNKHKKPIDGFEEGRVYNGFRFVYPLFDENNSYIGSVEVSFSSSSFQNIMSDKIRFSQFIFSKKIINKKVWKDELTANYVPSAISPMFLMDSSWKDSNFASLKKNIKDNLTPEIKKIFMDNLSLNRSFSLSLELDNTTVILSFLPIINPISKSTVGYLVVITESVYLAHLPLENTLFLFISFALLFSLFVIIYRRNLHEDEIQEQNNLLLEQSKMAQMGSMLSNIAHQWKQPLARINSKLIEIPLTLSLQNRDKGILDKHLEEIEDLTSHMADTIENFRTYFHPDKQQNYFYVSQTIDKAVYLLNLNNEKENINLIVNCSNDIRVHTHEDELIQVLIVLIINAKEALHDNKTEKPFINIIVEDRVSSVVISIIDNAGGIDDSILKQMFNPYFTTKQKENNSGIGLYMAKMIIEGSMNGKLKYEKRGSESHFKIILEGLINE